MKGKILSFNKTVLSFVRAHGAKDVFVMILSLLVFSFIIMVFVVDAING